MSYSITHALNGGQAIFLLSEGYISTSGSGKCPNGGVAITQMPRARALPPSQLHVRGNITKQGDVRLPLKSRPLFLSQDPSIKFQSQPTCYAKRLVENSSSKSFLSPSSNSPYPTHRYWPLQMFANLAKSVSLALLLTFITTVDAHCTKPRVRREWRSLSEAERGGWVAAVKVRSSDPKRHPW